MKITAISDLHGNLLNIKQIPSSDILLICGDINVHKDEASWVKTHFLPWCNKLLEKKVKDIVYISGNHDWFYYNLFLNQHEDTFKNSLPPHIHYLRDEMIEIEGIKIYGTPWQPIFLEWAFNAIDNTLEEYFCKIPPNMDILISHGPAFGFNDTVEYNIKSLGSKVLLNNIKRTNPKYFFSGHIHTGNHNKEEIVCNNNSITESYNVSLLNERYKLVYKPLTINI